MRKGVLAWSVAALLVLLLAGLPALWVWARQRAAAREKAEKAAVEALQLLASLRAEYRARLKTEWTGDVASLLAASMPSPSIPMPPEWEQIYFADLRGRARPTSYGYLFEALPPKGFLFRALPSADDRLGRATFVIDQGGTVLRN
ncbi:MAG TPA: hypothetical protein VF950_26900 [Planctomycetota bacterium]